MGHIYIYTYIHIYIYTYIHILLVSSISSVMKSTIEYYGIGRMDLKRLLPHGLTIANTGTNVTKKEALDVILTIADYVPNNIVTTLVGKDGLVKGQIETFEKYEEEKKKEKVPTGIL